MDARQSFASANEVEQGLPGVTGDERDSMVDTPQYKVTAVRVERTLPYPDGRPGVYVLRRRYTAPGAARSFWLQDALAYDAGEPCPPLDRHVVADVCIVGGGFCGHGMPFGPRVGQLLAEAVATGETPEALAPLRSSSE